MSNNPLHRVINSIDHDQTELLSYEGDDIALEAAARNSRLPFDKLTSHELACFPDVGDHVDSVKLYLYIRNKTCQLWLRDPLSELLYGFVLSRLAPPYDCDHFLVKRVHGFLQRYGYINFGVFAIGKVRPKWNGKRVLVIGAGAAGLAAARQLAFFGIEVVVIEARQRTGGRISTYRRAKPTRAADLGAMFVLGTEGNPIAVMSRQFPLKLRAISDKCPLYDPTGAKVGEARDRTVEEFFKEIMSTISALTKDPEKMEELGGKVSLGAAFDTIIKMHEGNHQTRRLKFWQDYGKYLDKLEEVRHAVILTRSRIPKLESSLRGLLDQYQTSAEGSRELIQPQMAFVRSELLDAYEGNTTGMKRMKELETTIHEYSKTEPAPKFMNDLDRALMNFHLANVEYANGCWMYESSMFDCEHDGESEMKGPHFLVENGFDTMTTELTEGLDIQLGHIVDHIEYTTEGVKVRCHQGVKNTLFNADVCLCTVPLGVLKEAVGDEPNALQFEPPLPPWKTHAIQTLGYGNLNKVILVFDKPFWATNDPFGRGSDDCEGRGECYVFCPVHEQGVLVAMMAGQSAFVCEEMKDQVIVDRAMMILSSIFGQACPRKPVDSVVTRWHTDKFAQGSYSFIAPESSAETYDKLAAPVCDAENNKKVFFAGEHTNRTYPATVHGAFLSGVREAGRIADVLIGCPFSPFGETNESNQ